jgi:triosephosphate isomerase
VVTSLALLHASSQTVTGTMRKKFIAGNWKMYTSLAAAKELAAAVAKGVTSDQVTVAVCPPYTWLTSVAEVLKGSHVGVGGQNSHYLAEGAYTGEVAPGMLKEAGCQYVIVGHSERRHGLNESDLFLNRKVKAATAAGLTVLFCVGELLSEREANQTEAVLQYQLDAGLSGLTAEAIKKVVIAYEPVWAIGTGKVATPEQAQETHAFIRKHFAKLFGQAAADALIIQYGGSVKPDNAAQILHQPDVDGALVGGASLKADSFLTIIKAAQS